MADLVTITSGWDLDLEAAAQKVAQEIDDLLGEIKNNELCLATNYVKLGSHLLKVRSNKYWLPLGFRSFGAFIESVKERIHAGRTQLYMYISTVEKLLPAVSEDQLNQMGISKAIELQRIVTQTQRMPTPELIESAVNPSTTRETLRGEVFKHLHLEQDTPGTYWDLGGFYVTPEEREEIKRGFDVATRVDPAIPQDWPEHARRKAIIQRLVQEFLGTYEELVNRGEG